MNLFKNSKAKNNRINNSLKGEMESNFYTEEIKNLTEVGSYSIDLTANTCTLDKHAAKILKTPRDYNLSLQRTIPFYAQEHREIAENLFNGCTKGKPFSSQLKMLSFDNQPVWVKTTGKPQFNQDQNITAIRGVFQNITKEKNQEIQLENSLRKIESQNFKFNNFAHIISHKLRNQVANMDMMLHLLKEAKTENDKVEILQALTTVSKNLTNTTTNLSDTVKINIQLKRSLKRLRFENVLNNVVAKLGQKIQESSANIYSDFSEFPVITYFPEYLEHILENLISNAIKFRSKNKELNISIFSYLENGKSHLCVKDNGIGIDIKKFGAKIFNMYQFLDKREATGTGLFNTKSQVEEMDGTIDIESSLGCGTKVIITF